MPTSAGRRILRALSPLPAAVGIWAMPFAAAAQQGGGGNYWPHGHWDGGWYGMFLGPVMMILVIAAAVAVVVLLVRWLGGGGHASHPLAPGRTPLDILKERFARGEIDKQEFEERRRVLGE